MLTFYCDLFGFQVTDSVEAEVEDGHEAAFLTSDPNMHHQLVIAKGRPADDDFSTVQQLSFRVGSLDDVRQFWRALTENPKVERMYTTTHGNAWSVYFWDPEGTRVEIYTDTPWACAQPCEEELDFTLSDDEIYAHTEKLVKHMESYQPFPEWRRGMADKMGLKDWPIKER